MRKRKNLELLLGMVIAASAAASAVMVLVKPAPPPIVPGGTVIVFGTGWVDKPEEVQAIAAALPFKSFADTPAFKETVGVPDHVYLWEYAKEAFGHNLSANNQGQVGSCVAFGAKGAIDHLQAVQMVKAKRAGRPPPEFKAVCPEVIYAGSRVEIGGGKLGSGDGSVGAWAFQFCQKYGVVAQAKYPSVDLSIYSETRCRSWGRSGVPGDIEVVAKNNPVRDGVQVKTPDEAESALANGYPITVASNQGFAMQRDAEGFARAQGSWGHQMCILGYKKGKRPAFLIWNSWGPDWCSGPKGEGDPPDGAFWAERAVVARMLAADDSWAYADLKGFPSRKPDLFLKTRPAADPRVGENAYALAP